MTIRTRKNVYSLPAGDQTIDWYRKAVARLLQKPATDPTSWIYMAAVHGTSNPVPPPTQNFWDQCQHQSWYFLSWHRGYITSFEAVVARTVKALGGPADWALPYWDYTQALKQNRRARLMPASFFNARMPDGSRNALWSQRRSVVGGNFGLTDAMVSRGALNVADFTRAQPGAPVGFGGPITGFHPGGGTSGALENVPHNIVHVQIGGLMGNPNTAALDPIFWLHHCNIDRLWEMWRSNHADSADHRWLDGVSFQMHDGAGQPFTYTSSDMLDSTRVLHGFRYDDVPPVIRASTESVEEGLESMTEGSDDQRQPELAGANEGPIDITSGNRTIVSMAESAFAESVASAAPSKVYLNLENVTGSGENGNFYVYVDLPDDGREPAFVGMLSTFGVERATKSEDMHGGSGISLVLDISEAAAELGINQGNLDRLRVTFEPVGAPEEAELESVEPGDSGDTDDGDGELPEAVLEFLGPDLESVGEQRIQVGRVSLFVE
jgi:tyrosinase